VPLMSNHHCFRFQTSIYLILALHTLNLLLQLTCYDQSVNWSRRRRKPFLYLCSPGTLSGGRPICYIMWHWFCHLLFVQSEHAGPNPTIPWTQQCLRTIRACWSQPYNPMNTTMPVIVMIKVWIYFVSCFFFHCFDFRVTVMTLGL
jgi:hypothetical protein